MRILLEIRKSLAFSRAMLKERLGMIRSRIRTKAGVISSITAFEELVNASTKARDEEIVKWAEQTRKIDEKYNADRLRSCGDEIVDRGAELRRAVLASHKDKLKASSKHRILIHVPSKEVSPAGYYLFTNLQQSLEFIGVDALPLSWEGGELAELLERYQPTMMLTSDAESYLCKIDWPALAKYRKAHPFRVGLTASLKEYGNSPLRPRLEWARRHEVNFYYSFRTQEYIHERKQYKPFFKAGFKIASVEFGANPIVFYPELAKKDLDFIFLASINPQKWPRYFEYLPEIVRDYAGFINGPGWSWASKDLTISANRYVYARAKVGINLHIQESIDWPNELNERTYILAACGVPQLIDNPKLLLRRFPEGSMFMARNPKEYVSLFKHMLQREDECRERSMKALEAVYAKHTTLHRAESFIKQLDEIL